MVASPDPRSGWGLIDPAAAIGAAPGGGDDSGRGSGPGTAVVVLLVLALVLGVLAVTFHLRASGVGRR
ncbi:hypothetical protein [Micromonospora zhanjiangensis]